MLVLKDATWSMRFINAALDNGYAQGSISNAPRRLT